MKKELIERFKEGKIAINLETQQEWNEFMQWLEDNTDIRWSSGFKPTERSLWEYSKEYTAIKNDDGIRIDHTEIVLLRIVKYKDLKEKKGMKTSEFIKRVEELGYEVDNISFPTVLRIVAGEDVWIASVETNALNKVDTRYDANIPSELFDLLVEYARTPIDEREEQSKYYWKIKGLGSLWDENHMYLNYVDGEGPKIDTKVEAGTYQTQFTEKEFKEICEKHNITAEFEKEEIGETK